MVARASSFPAIGYPIWGIGTSTAASHTATAEWASGGRMFLAFEHGVMYVLSFATIITVVATVLSVTVLLVMAVGRSIWRLFR